MPTQEEFLRAVKEGNLEIVNQYIQQHADHVTAINDAVDPEGKTALILAVCCNHPSVVTALLAVRGLNVDALDRETDDTALTWAAYHGRVAMVSDLLAAGANVNVSPMASKSRTALMSAIEKKYDDVAQILIEAKGADLNLVDANGDTALIMAVKKKNHLIVQRLLLKPSVDTTIKNNLGLAARDLVNADIRLKQMFPLDFQKSVNALFDSMDVEANKKDFDPEKAQKIVDASLSAAQQGIAGVMKHLGTAKNLRELGPVMLQTAQLLLVLGAGCDSVDEKKQCDETARHLLAVGATVMKDPNIKRIVDNFKSQGEEEEHVSKGGLLSSPVVGDSSSSLDKNDPASSPPQGVVARKNKPSLFGSNANLLALPQKPASSSSVDSSLSPRSPSPGPSS